MTMTSPASVAFGPNKSALVQSQPPFASCEYDRPILPGAAIVNAALIVAPFWAIIGVLAWLIW
jgi:hypothetical protein